MAAHTIAGLLAKLLYVAPIAEDEISEDRTDDDVLWSAARDARALSDGFPQAAVTLADLCLIPQLGNARRFGVSVDDLPKRLSGKQAREAPLAFAAAHPDAACGCDASATGGPNATLSGRPSRPVQRHPSARFVRPALPA
jgi:hypothetical protein